MNGVWGNSKRSITTNPIRNSPQKLLSVNDGRRPSWTMADINGRDFGQFRVIDEKRVKRGKSAKKPIPICCHHLGKQLESTGPPSNSHNPLIKPASNIESRSRRVRFRHGMKQSKVATAAAFESIEKPRHRI